MNKEISLNKINHFYLFRFSLEDFTFEDIDEIANNIVDKILKNDEKLLCLPDDFYLKELEKEDLVEVRDKINLILEEMENE